MNVEERVLALAIQASEDEDAVPVLADYIIETGWWDARLSEPKNEQGHYYRLRMRGEPNIPPQDREEFLGAVAAGACSLRSRCKPIVAVLMFGRWPRDAWELTDTCLYVEALGYRHPAYRNKPCGTHVPMGFDCQCWSCVTTRMDAEGRYYEFVAGWSDPLLEAISTEAQYVRPMTDEEAMAQVRKVFGRSQVFGLKLA